MFGYFLLQCMVPWCNWCCSGNRKPVYTRRAFLPTKSKKLWCLILGITLNGFHKIVEVEVRPELGQQKSKPRASSQMTGQASQKQHAFSLSRTLLLCFKQPLLIDITRFSDARIAENSGSFGSELVLNYVCVTYRATKKSHKASSCAWSLSCQRNAVSFSVQENLKRTT